MDELDVSQRNMSDPNYPSHHDEFKKQVEDSGGYSSHLGFTGGPSFVYRFCNRYRLAKAFTGLGLDGYSASTVSGYSGLAGVFLTWSTFELFCSITSLSQYDQPAKMDHGQLTALRLRILALDTSAVFLDFLKSKANASLKGRIEAFETGDVLMTPFVAAAIRHIFGHGHLSAHPKGADPANISALCEQLRSFLLAFMDQRFTSLVGGKG